MKKIELYCLTLEMVKKHFYLKENALMTEWSERSAYNWSYSLDFYKKIILCFPQSSQILF